ncbi:hypothetical protein GCM10010909_35320 [Acidocella aquatica]|uniref:Uncharacterized protein n=2 Tax=Acidocella aquatica TaxID=1922313 RepID=A0ABQ6ABN8_9PROT|nr:hypothetical protein GCM10010909_35320 [Acidocella aquatica]
MAGRAAKCYSRSMKASIYTMADGLYLAVLDNGQRVIRDSLSDLASVLRGKGVASENLLFGDWLNEAELLAPTHREMLRNMIAGP